MGNIESVRAIYGLSGQGTPTKTLVSGSSTIGVNNIPIPFPDADIVMSFKITFNAVDDVVTLDLETMTATATTGTPTIVDGDGKDFEGEPIPSSENSILYSISTITEETNSEAVEVADVGSTGVTDSLNILLGSGHVMCLSRASNTDVLGAGTPNNITFTSKQVGGTGSSLGDTVTVTVAAKSA